MEPSSCSPPTTEDDFPNHNPSLNNVSSFYDTTAERSTFPMIKSSLSLDNIMVPDDSDDENDTVVLMHGNRSRGVSDDAKDDFGKGKLSPSPDDEDDEITQIRTANLMQRTLFTELEKLKNTDAETSEHPLLQGEIRNEESEVLVTGELKSKATPSTANIIATIMNEAKFDSWQEGFSLYLQTHRRLSGAGNDNLEELKKCNAGSGSPLILSPTFGTPDKSSQNSFVPWEKRPEKGAFLFGDIDWSTATSVEKNNESEGRRSPNQLSKGPLLHLTQTAVSSGKSTPVYYKIFLRHITF